MHLVWGKAHNFFLINMKTTKRKKSMKKKSFNTEHICDLHIFFITKQRNQKKKPPNKSFYRSKYQNYCYKSMKYEAFQRLQ